MFGQTHRAAAVAVLGLALTTSACVMDETDAGEAAMPVTDGTPEADGVLGLLNDAGTTFALLDDDVALDRRAAQNLINHRNGSDGLLGTSDDDLFDTIVEVDAVSYIGPSALQKILDYALANGWVPEGGDVVGVYDGVPFTEEEAAATLDLANTAAEQVLDDDVALDSRAAANIIAARPIPSLLELSAVGYVGQSALGKMKAYAVANGYGSGGEVEEPTVVGVSTLADEIAAHGTSSQYFGKLVNIPRAIVTSQPYVASNGSVSFQIAAPAAGNVQQLKVYIAASAAQDTSFLSLFDDVVLTGVLTQYGAEFEILLDDGSVHAAALNSGGLGYDAFDVIQAAWPSTAGNPEGVVRVVATFGYTYMVPMPLVLDHPMWGGNPPAPPTNSGNEQDHNWLIAAQQALDAWR